MTKTIEFIFDFVSPNGYLVWWPLKELAARAGGKVSIMTLSKYENGMILPGPGVLAALSKAFELPVEFFSKEVSRHNYIALFKFGPAFLHRGGPEQRYVAEEYFSRHAELDDLLGELEAKPLWKASKGVMTYAKTEEWVEEARQAMGFGGGPRISRCG